MISSKLHQAADFLANKRLSLTQFDVLPNGIRPSNLSEAYATQDLVVAALIATKGGAPIGYKVACTSQLAREALNVPHPLFGQLLSFSTHTSGAVLHATDFTTRTIEPEFGFQMAEDVPESDAPYTQKTVAQFVGPAFAGIEIVNHRFLDWSVAGANTVAADNAIHGAWIYGEPTDLWRELDLIRQSVVLYANGYEVRRGTGAAVLDHPLNVVAWLANELPKFGKQLKRGDYITTGVVSDVYPAKQGENILADFGKLGTVSLSFA